LRKWKKYTARILSAIKVSAKAIIKITDNEWFEELADLIEQGKNRIESAKNTEQLFATLSASLAEISFFQIGKIPNNIRSQQTTLRHPSNWKLNTYRSVQYVQSQNQLEAKKIWLSGRKKTRG